jgi:hypothetical protein
LISITSLESAANGLYHFFHESAHSHSHNNHLPDLSLQYNNLPAKLSKKLLVLVHQSFSQFSTVSTSFSALSGFFIK